MKQSKGIDSQARALIGKPPLAMVVRGDGQASAGAATPGLSREARIRETAYARYESRGHAHGHDIDDWLAAEAILDGKL